MYFASDNAGPVHPNVMQAMIDANTGYAPAYGNDALMDQVRDQLRMIFEAPDASVHLVINGTSANVLTLATLCQPFETIFCTSLAHIQMDECGAPEFYTGGAKLTLIPDVDGKMTSAALRKALDSEGNRFPHGPERGPVSITQVTETGTCYSLADIKAISDIAHAHNLPVHLDGARFANALDHLGCSAADMTWKSGVDAVCFGGTKNGLMGVEAVVFFDPDKGREFELRRKRGGHLLSKHRYLSAQMQAYLTDDLWLSLAKQSNQNADYLAQGLIAGGATLAYPVEGNLMFASLPRATHQRLIAAGAQYQPDADIASGDPDTLVQARFVCDWSIAKSDIDQFLALL